MCLIIAGPAAKLRETLLNTPGLVEDIYRTNPDGIGMMYASRRGLRIFKSLPKNADQARHFLTRLPGDDRNLAVHFRWTTHGWTDKINCHPYTIVDGEAALMHNGVLRQGNSDDRTKSDTWHFIKNYLENVVKLAPAIVHDVGYKAMLKDFIGSSNRFVLMTKDGRCSIVNAKEGVEHDGLWFSNTYAWRPGILIKNHNGGSSYQGGGFRGGYGYGPMGGYDDYGDDYDTAYGGAQSGTPKSTTSGYNGSSVVHNGGVTSASRFNHRTVHQGAGYTTQDEAEERAWRQTVQASQSRISWPNGVARTNGAGANRPEYSGSKEPAFWTAPGNEVSPRHAPLRDALEEALDNSDVDTMASWFLAFPRNTIHLMFNVMHPMPTKWTSAGDLDGYHKYLYDAVIDRDRQALINECEKPDSKNSACVCLAEVVCYYLDWLTYLEWSKRKWEAQNTDPDPERKLVVVGGKAVASTAPSTEEEYEKKRAVQAALYEAMFGEGTPPTKNASQAQQVDDPDEDLYAG